MGQYTLTIPMAGHAVITVEAATPAEAIQRAFEDVTATHFEGWELLTSFARGSVLHCPSPWTIVIEDEDGNEVEAND